MKRLRWIGLVGAMIVMMALGSNGPGQDGAGVYLRVVKYDGLKEEVIRNRGKVVLVDFWGEFCFPCKKGFPHVVQLHRQYAKDGLAIISVSVDDLSSNSGETKARVLAFLRQNGATFTNLLLDETPAVNKEKLRLTTVPCYYIFNRQGKWTQFGSNSGEKVDYPAMDRLIHDLLQEK